MDDEEGSSSSKVETAKANISVWLMKCPVVVAKTWQSHPPSDPTLVAKVVLSLDPLRPPEDPTALETSLVPRRKGLKVLALVLQKVLFLLMISEAYNDQTRYLQFDTHLRDVGELASLEKQVLTIDALRQEQCILKKQVS